MVQRIPAFVVRATLAAAVVALAILASPAAKAATLYKLIDTKGNVTYAASAPSPFNGKVIRMEVDPDSQRGITPAGDSRPAADGTDYLSQRRARWAAVEEKLGSARAWLDEAKQNLASATMMDDEVEWVAKAAAPSVPPAQIPPAQTPTRQNTPGQKPPALQQSPLVVTDTRMCNEVVRNGKRFRACVRPVGNQKFIDRMAYLEAQVKDAEAAVAEAEVAYRRGMD